MTLCYFVHHYYRWWDKLKNDADAVATYGIVDVIVNNSGIAGKQRQIHARRGPLYI